MEGATYWCHVCSQRVDPIMESNLKCPLCRAGFIEEMDSSEQALSLWAPLLLGMMGNPHSRRRFTPHLNLLQQDNNTSDDRELESVIRRRTSTAALLQLLQAGNDMGRDHRLFINPFGSLGDYFIGPGLDLLLQHLAENDPNRHGTMPAQKEVVDALPTVKVEHTMQCCVCLDDFQVADQAKEMPCKHKFHTSCIVTWLDLHSSCPVCRFQLPADESKRNTDLSRTITSPSTPSPASDPGATS